MDFLRPERVNGAKKAVFAEKMTGYSMEMLYRLAVMAPGRTFTKTP